MIQTTQQNQDGAVITEVERALDDFAQAKTSTAGAIMSEAVLHTQETANEMAEDLLPEIEESIAEAQQMLEEQSVDNDEDKAASVREELERLG